MRSAVANKMSEKLGILRERRRQNLECQPGKEATRRNLQWRKPVSMFLKRVWRNCTKANESSLGYRARKKKLNLGSTRLSP
ncbi:hypothetical protein BHE74_00044693 [Ensete ventricosum]|nr:hypothetical protein BHE74_00044693 [Ensete ventricosum]